MADGSASARDRWAESTQLADEVAAFARYPGATVHVVARGSAEWSRYAVWAQEQFAETDQTLDALVKGLGQAAGRKERNPVWRARRAARDVFFRNEAGHAVIATLGDSRLFTVAGFVRPGAALVIVGAGSTHPEIGGAAADRVRTESAGNLRIGAEALTIRPGHDDQAGAGVPPARHFGAAAWYAVNALAAEEARSVVDRVPPATWRGAGIALERPVVMRRDGDVRATGQNWTAEEVEDLAVTTTGRLPGERNPFSAVDGALGFTTRHWAKEVRQSLDSGWTVGIESVPDQGRSICSVVINDPAGNQRFAGTLHRSANGTVRMSNADNAPPQAQRAFFVMALREAARLGVGIHQSRTTAYELDAATVAQTVQSWRAVLGPRLDELPGLGWAEAGSVGATPSAVAEAVARFRDAGGDVVRLQSDDPQFEVVRQQLADRMAAALRVPMDDEALRRLDGADAAGRELDPGLAGMWQAFNPPVGVASESGLSRGADYTDGKARYPEGAAVAVAIGSEGTVLAAAGYRKTSQRIEIGAVGAVAPGGDDALTAAIVDGVYDAGPDRPIGGYVSEQVAAAYRQAGARVGGPAALDAEWLTSVEVTEEAAKNCLRQAYQARPHLDPVHANRLAEHLREFAGSGVELAVLDHAAQADRRRAAHVFDVLSADRDDQSQQPRALGSASDSLHRATVVLVEGGEPVAFATVDSRPEQPIEIVDAVSPGINQRYRAAMAWWLQNHQARLGREMRASEVVQRKFDLDPEVDSVPYELAHSRRMVVGIHNRLGDRMDGLATGAGSQVPGTNGAAIQLPPQARQVDQSSLGRPGHGGAQRGDKPRGQER